MLLGFYDRNNNGLAVELSPEMAKAIASYAREIFNTAKVVRAFEDVSEVRLARFAFEQVHELRTLKPKKGGEDGFFVLPEFEQLFDSDYEPTGVWIWTEDNEPTVFWEIYSSLNRQATPFLNLAQLDAIATNQPLPQE